jgi:hypothetical protein
LHGAETLQDVVMAGAIKDTERLIDLVRGNDDIANHADGCDRETIAAAERELGIQFPPSYRRAVEEFGTWDIAGEEFLGVYRTPGMGRTLLGSVHETLDARRFALPADLIVVMFDGMGGLVVLDSSRTDAAGEYPVCCWDPGLTDRHAMEILGGTFGQYALALCQRAVGHWRAVLDS